MILYRPMDVCYWFITGVGVKITTRQFLLDVFIRRKWLHKFLNISFVGQSLPYTLKPEKAYLVLSLSLRQASSCRVIRVIISPFWTVNAVLRLLELGILFCVWEHHPCQHLSADMNINSDGVSGFRASSP